MVLLYVKFHIFLLRKMPGHDNLQVSRYTLLAFVSKACVLLVSG